MMSCMMGNHIDLPRPITEDDHGVLEGTVVDLWARMYEKDDGFTKRAIGRFIPEFTKPIQEAHSGINAKTKMTIFSGHDSTLIPILIAFKTYQGQYPRFGANVSFE